MLTFQYVDFERAFRGCLKRFEKNILITASLHSVKELLHSGRREYEKDSCWQLLNHNAYAIRLLASTILVAMYKLAYQEKCSEKILGHIDVDEPHPWEVKDSDLSKKMHRSAWLKEPEIEEWCKIFNIPFSLKVDFNLVYYTNF